MELSSDSEIDRVRTAINSLRSDCPNLAQRFKDKDVQSLISAHITDEAILRSVSRQDLREVGLPIGLAALLKPGGLPRPFPLFPRRTSIHSRALAQQSSEEASSCATVLSSGSGPESVLDAACW